MSVRRLIALLAVALPLAFATSAHAYVYWGDYQGGTIGRANLDGTAVEDAFIQTGGNPDAVAVTATHIYWANETAGTIGRANIDGTAVEPNFITGIKGPRGVAINAASIFWASLGGNEIGRANLDGTGKTLGLVTATQSPCSVGIDSGHIYWGSTGLTSYIGRSSLTGNAAEREWVNLGTYIPCGVATNSANVFFADSGAFGGFPHEIGRVNINGTFVDKSMIGDADGACGLTVDGSKLYWANQGNDTIGVANTDATDVNESLVETGGNVICGVAVDSLSSPLIPPPTPPTGNEPGTGSGGASNQSPPTPSPQPPTPGTLRWLRAKDDTKHGTARVSLAVNEAGVVSVTGKGIVAATAQASAAGTVTVTLRATKAKRSALKRTGKLATKVTASFRPGDNGAPAVLAQPITLRLTAGSKR